MPAKLSLPTIHPAVEMLQNVCRLLHFVAAIFITVNAMHQLSAHEGSKIICYTQFVIAADIFILVFFGGTVFKDAPKTGVIFRVIEGLTFTGISCTLIAAAHPWLGLLHILLAAFYYFIAYREWKIAVSESLELKTEGITVPDIWQHAEIKWLHVKKVVTSYNAVVIETVRDQKIQLELRHNLKIEELQQINEICSLHSQLGG